MSDRRAFPPRLSSTASTTFIDENSVWIMELCMKMFVMGPDKPGRARGWTKGAQV